MRADFGMGDNQPERDAVRKIEVALAGIHEIDNDRQWIFHNERVRRLETELDRLPALAAELSSPLHAKLSGFAAEVRGQYRTLLVGMWVTSVTAALLFCAVRAAVLSLDLPAAANPRLRVAARWPAETSVIASAWIPATRSPSWPRR